METTEKLPERERCIRDAKAARALWGRLRTSSQPRRERWATIQNQLDGAPPLSNSELIANGQGWRCNVNFRDAASTLEQVLVSYWRLLHDTTNLAAVTVQDKKDPNTERWAQIFQDAFNLFNDDWGADYVRNYLLFSQNHVSFGVGVTFWNDRFSPRWEALRVGEIEVPAKAKASIDKLKIVAIRQEMEPDDLWELIKTPEKRATAAQRGWNPAEIDRLLTVVMRDPGERSSPVTPGDVLETQRALRNNTLGATAGRDPVSLIHLVARDSDGRITRKIFAETEEDAGEFLFDDYGAERPESMNEVIAAVFFDAGNGDWWGTKGFGQKNFQMSSVLNRLKSRGVDRTMIDGLTFTDTQDGSRETVPITNIGPFNIIPSGLVQVPSYPTGRSIIETIEMLESNQAFNNARYRDQSRQIAGTDTATQANILASLQSQVDVANATLYLRQIAQNIFREQFRRLRLKGNTDPDAKAFFKRCVTDAGMPEEVFYKSEIFIRTGAEPGAANMTLRGQKALELAQLPDANRRWWQETYVAANFGAQAVAKALNPEDAREDIKSARLAIMENSDMGEGNPLPVDPQDNHAAHVPVHIQPLEVLVHNFDVTGQIEPNAMIALQLVLPHIEAHLNFLKGDKLHEEIYRDAWPRFTAVRSAAEGIFRMAEKMHNQAQTGGQPQRMDAAVGAGAPQ